ncbi:hypothetical protein KTO58_12030 [Chitinophaga pendula]|uniref:hypothetical protein n=1 Tax=Chitinophaga TaxID=79328 RepID=UPI000BAF246E|nr:MULTISPECIES: hypothetical protein [Chitinophaga]ASZ12507.1 hypothetical protein CK934_16855 [Chitinophaga sp. MD30]UCJ09889.1 hypothetical protein KTO58_12030 [Chitinophaga pendula]
MGNKNLQELLKKVMIEENQKEISSLDDSAAYMIRGGKELVSGIAVEGCSKIKGCVKSKDVLTPTSPTTTTASFF